MYYIYLNDILKLNLKYNFSFVLL